MAEAGHAGDLMARAVLFDLDGTLLDTLDDLTASVNAALRQFGYPTRTRDEVCGFVGNGVQTLVERAVPADCANFDAVFQAFRAHYSDHCSDLTRPYPGIPALLTALRERGIRPAVVSNKMDAAVKTLCRQYFAPWIDVAIGESAEVRRKPAPDAALLALRELDVPASDAVYVGDSDVDIATAANAGLPCISVCWGFRDRAFLQQHGAAVLCDTPEELLALL